MYVKIEGAQMCSPQAAFFANMVSEIVALMRPYILIHNPNLGLINLPPLINKPPLGSEYLGLINPP